MNNKIEKIFTALGVLLIGAALVFNMLHFQTLIVYIILTVGIVMEVLAKLVQLLEHKKENRAIYADAIIMVIYVAFIVVLWFYN